MKGELSSSSATLARSHRRAAPLHRRDASLNAPAHAAASVALEVLELLGIEHRAHAIHDGMHHALAQRLDSTPLLFRWPARPGGLLAHWQGPYFNRPQCAVAAEGEPPLRPLTANAFKLPVFISGGLHRCVLLDPHNPHVGPA